MKKEEAIAKIQHQIQLIDNLKIQCLWGKEFEKWKRDTQICITKIFGYNTQYVNDFKDIFFYSPKIAFGNSYDKSLKDKFFLQALDKAHAILESMIREIEEYWEEPDMNQLVISHFNNIEIICNRFDSVARQLQIRHSKRQTIKINDEYDVQDLFHALLTLYFDDIRDEECTPSCAGCASRVDFLLKTEQTVIEIKKTSEKLTDKEIGEQLIVDITRYKSHPDCKTLICFVYDPERRIKNPRGIENDLSKTTDGLAVKVFIRPL